MKSSLELARDEFLRACVSELERHPIKFRTIKAVGVPCGEIIAYAEKRYRSTGEVPTPWLVMCRFEYKLRLILKEMTLFDAGVLSVRRGMKIKIGVEGSIKDTFEIGDVPAFPTATITGEDIRRHMAAARAERKKLN